MVNKTLGKNVFIFTYEILFTAERKYKMLQYKSSRSPQFKASITTLLDSTGTEKRCRRF